MRSVVVVLPASMWAMIPMLRVLSSGYSRGTVSSLRGVRAFQALDTRKPFPSPRYLLRVALSKRDASFGKGLENSRIDVLPSGRSRISRVGSLGPDCRGQIKLAGSLG